MPAYYATARRMLGVTENKILGDADHMLKQIADQQGCGDSFYRTDVAIPATVTVDGKVYENVGTGFRGNTSFMMVRGKKK